MIRLQGPCQALAVALENTTTKDSGASVADKDEEENDGDAEGADSVSVGQTANKKRKNAGRTLCVHTPTL